MQLVVIEKRIVDYVVKLQETQIDSDEVSSMLVCEFIYIILRLIKSKY